jgi:hypothetical protein
VTEKQLPATPEGLIPELDRIYDGYGFSRESGKEGKTGYMAHQGDCGSLNDLGCKRGIKRKPVGDWKHGLEW